jgi:hypothetical protein
MVRIFALAATFAVIAAGLSADLPATGPSDEIGLLVQRTDMSSAALALRIHRNCLESVEGRWPAYQSVTVNALCVIGKSEIQTISSMRIVLFGLAVQNERAQSIPTATRLSDSAYDDIISNKLIFGYDAHGRLLTYSDDAGQPRAHGAFALEARDREALLSFVACDTYWRGGGGYMPSLIGARCRAHGTIDGVRLFVAFDLVAPTSRKALEGAVSRAVRQVIAAQRPAILNIPLRGRPG